MTFKSLLLKYLILLCLFSLSSNIAYSQHDANLFIFEGTDNYTSTIDKNFTTLDYEDYKVLIIGKAPGIIKIINKHNNDTIISCEKSKYYNSFFVGIFSSYALIDNGTGNMRGLRIFDLKNGKNIFQTKYKHNPKIINEKLVYEYPFTTEKTPSNVNCPDKDEILQRGGNIGYLEKIKYNFQTSKLEKTGQIRCEYFE